MDWFGKRNENVELVDVRVFRDDFVEAIAFIVVDQKMILCLFVMLNKVTLVAPYFRL